MNTPNTSAAVRVYEGSLTIPTYEHSGREVEPALFRNSTVAGNHAGDGAHITASAVLTVTNNVFVTNSYYGLYFNPSSGSKTAVVAVSVARESAPRAWPTPAAAVAAVAGWADRALCS